MSYETEAGCVVYVSHSSRQCGVYQFGLNVFGILSRSRKFQFVYTECSSASELLSFLRTLAKRPIAIIYNYSPLTMGWLTPAVTGKIAIPQIGALHYFPTDYLNNPSTVLFDYFIIADPTIKPLSSKVFGSGRLVRSLSGSVPVTQEFTVGSFGFGLPGKGFEKLVRIVQEEFDEASIRIRIPFAAFGDAQGTVAKAIAARCRDILWKPGISLEINHEFIEDSELMDFLSSNTVNAFFYTTQPERTDLSSVVDYALASRRPVALSGSNLFRHVVDLVPTSCIDKYSLKSIVEAGSALTRPLRDEWSEENFLWEYERMISSIVGRPLAWNWARRKSAFFAQQWRNFSALSAVQLCSKVYRRLRDSRPGRAISRRLFARVKPSAPQWRGFTRQISNGSGKPALSVLNPAFGSAAQLLNRDISLGSTERLRPALALLYSYAPETMENERAPASLKCAFLFDYALRKAASSPECRRILVIGAGFESLVKALRAFGFLVDEFRPHPSYGLTDLIGRPAGGATRYDFALGELEGGSLVAFVQPILSGLAQEVVFVSCLPRRSLFPDAGPDSGVGELVSSAVRGLEDVSLGDDPHWRHDDEVAHPYRTFALKRGSRSK